MRKSFLDYSMSVIVSRALPDVRDGLKPVHRRILYTMYENSLYPDKAYRKCADTVGSVLGRYHPHGDASVYDALVRLAQDFSLRYPLVDGHGNFGSVDGDPAAAYRYTEARMSKISMEMLTDIDKDTIDFQSNYDDRLQEPVMLPSRFPNLLVNGSTGIAVGMATNIPPHNLTEVIDAVNLLIDNPDADLFEIMEYIKGPDFPTAGIIMGYSGIRAAYATGRGKITLRARAEIQEWKNNRYRIVVTELPYMVNKARLIENIANLVKEKRINEISDLRDESDRNGMHFVIELKRDANPQVVLNQLYRFTQLQDTVGVIMLALVDGQPKVLTLKETLQHYIHFQSQVIRRRTEFELRKAKEREHILEGLKIALDYIDEVISIIRSSKDQPDAKEKLMERFGLSEIQATAIVQMRLGQLSGLERQKIEDELAALLHRIHELEEILASEHLVLEILKKEINELKRRFGDERRTEIQTISGEVDIEDLIPEEDCVVTLTHFGYMKRQPVDVYKLQKRGGRGVSGMKQREEDFVEELFISSTHENVLFITNKGRMYKLKCYEIPEGSRTSQGMNVVNLLSLEADEKVAYMLKVKEFDEDKYLVMTTKKGLIKRTKLDAYKNVRKNGLIAIGLNDEDELSSVRLTNGDSEILIATKNGMSIRLDEREIRPLSRSARGVRAIKLREGDEVVSMARLREGATVMTVTTKGQGRRTLIEDYRLQARGGYGKINYKTSDVKGDVAGIKVVDENEDLILIADDGIIIRIRVSDVNVMSRYAGGVRVMRLSPDARVVTFARAEHDDEEEIEAVDNTAVDEDVNMEELEALEKELEKEEATLTPEEEIEETEDTEE
ncbi:DNA gyrase subunit A [Paludicola sp. MB14-C6]|uniref:DNA gyrase subunit A n=1 Tax=Paludihabitans sp. MB14-C6 TaxID=3070656 RepID=UPI0027DC2ADB|nr:DNA gyrase subunit A [Paludicola sp. MB14-C6]WMJ24453.1 DNA gyrase subunit A [Paludicola sp. MB14-C6]